MKTMLIVFLLLGFASASQAECLRCNNDLVCTDETRFDAVNKCGQPDHTDATQTTTRKGGKRNADYIVGEKVERLYYNCGEGRLTRILIIKDGKIESITNGQRGSGPVRCD